NVQGLDIQLKQAKDAFITSNQTSLEGIELVWTEFVFQPSKDYTTPLSWKMTHKQKEEIDKAWQRICDDDKSYNISNNLNETPLQTVDHFFWSKDRHAN